MKPLARCPCGQIPAEIGLYDAGQGGKYAYVSGSCCGEWMIEFRVDYKELDSIEAIELATAAWNSAPRMR